MIPLFHHVAHMGNWKQVVGEQSRYLKRAGYDREVMVGLSGFPGRPASLADYVIPHTIVSASPYLEDYEYPTLHAVHDYALANPGKLVAYIHTKGVSHPHCAWSRLWRVAMMVETVRFITSGRHLDTTAIAGFAWTRSTTWVNHFRGNFWIAGTDYLATLQPPGEYCVDTVEAVPMTQLKERYPAEGWVGSGSPSEVVDLCTCPKWDHSVELHPHMPNFWRQYPKLKDYYEAEYHP